MGDQAKMISFTDGITLEVVHNNFIQYVVGGITLSILAGLGFGLVTFILLKIFRKR